MFTIEIAGTPHAYQLTPPVGDPDAPTLVFVHGWLLSRHYWQPLIDDLSGEYRCLAYDLRGFGDSQPVSQRNGTSGADGSGADGEASGAASYSLEAYARDLECLLATLEIERAWLVGHSLGGSIALWGGEICRQRVQGIICANAGGGIYLREEFERFRTAGTQLVRFRPAWLKNLPLADWAFSQVMVARPLERRWGRQRLADFLRADRTAALGSLLESTTEREVHRLPQLVARLSQPTYFLAGDRDRIMEPRYVSHLASFHALFGENLIEMPDCGHMSMVECPTLMAAKVREILTRH